MALVSVIPQPVFGSALLKDASICFTCSGARGAPPPPTVIRLLRSRLVRFASRTRSPVMAAGATKDVMRSRSTSAAASTGSHLYIETILRWAR